MKSATVETREAVADSPLQLGLEFESERDWYAATERWVKENPRAYQLFVRFALDLGKKRDRFGFKLIAERVRWEMAFEYGDVDFKVNNSLVAYIARRVVREHPELAGKVEFRRVSCGPSKGRG